MSHHLISFEYSITLLYCPSTALFFGWASLCACSANQKQTLYFPWHWGPWRPSQPSKTIFYLTLRPGTVAKEKSFGLNDGKGTLFGGRAKLVRWIGVQRENGLMLLIYWCMYQKGVVCSKYIVDGRWAGLAAFINIWCGSLQVTSNPNFDAVLITRLRT